MTRAAAPTRAASKSDGPRRRRLGGGVACLVLLGLTLAALGHVAVQARHLDVALMLGKEQKTLGELLEQKRRLKSDIGRLKDPGRISGLAKDRLKMEPVAPADIRALGGSAGRQP